MWNWCSKENETKNIDIQRCKREIGMFHWEWCKDFQKTYLFLQKKKTVKVLAKIVIINFFSTLEVNQNVQQSWEHFFKKWLNLRKKSELCNFVIVALQIFLFQFLSPHLWDSLEHLQPKIVMQTYSLKASGWNATELELPQCPISTEWSYWACVMISYRTPLTRLFFIWSSWETLQS